MLTYRLDTRVNGISTYLFFPEGKELFGKVVFDSFGEVLEVVDAENDVKRMYAVHAIHGIDISRNEGIVAWC